MKYRLGELYCGAGGAILGASAATYLGSGFEHEWVTDWNDDALETIRLNDAVPSENVICADVNEIDFRDLSNIDGLMFGFPCNNFSHLSAMCGTFHGLAGQYGYGAQRGVDCIAEKNPLFFVAENVKGLLSVNGGSDYRAILFSLENAGAGYDVAPHVYKMEQYGLPQARWRVVFVGFRKDLGISFWPPRPFATRAMSSGEVLTDIPDYLSHHNKRMASGITALRLGYIKEGENAFTAEMPADIRPKTYVQIKCRRIQRSKPSPTVVAGGGGGFLCHWEEPRYLTLRELARLQTFPDDYDFVGNNVSISRQIGMAVPPAFARIIFESVLQHLEGKVEQNR